MYAIRSYYEIQTMDGDPVDGEIHTIAWDPVSAARGEYKHFMQKEIYEQPRALTDTIGGRIEIVLSGVCRFDIREELPTTP